VLAFAFLHCRHKSKQERMCEAWTLVNPLGSDQIALRDVREFFMLLKYISVEQRLDYIQLLPSGDRSEEVI